MDEARPLRGVPVCRQRLQAGPSSAEPHAPAVAKRDKHDSRAPPLFVDAAPPLPATRYYRVAKRVAASVLGVQWAAAVSP